MIRNSLFLKIYLTVLGSLALVALLLTTAAFLGKFDPADPVRERISQFAIVMYPTSDTSDDWQRTTVRLAQAFGADITLFAPDGTILAQSSTDPEDAKSANPEKKFAMFRNHGLRNFTAQLPDGRSIEARLHEPFHPPRTHVVLLILLIAAVIGIAAYPVVRHLTRRLDVVRTGMKIWGDGRLDTRLPVTGNDELSAVARTFNQAADQIETLIESQKSLLANASHELRSPLARLRMAIEMWKDARTEKLEQEIVRNLSELDDLVGEILLTSKLESHASPSLDDDVDLLVLLAEEGAGERVDVHGSSLPVRGNARLLRRMVRNLLQNANRHGAPPVMATVTGLPDNFIQMTVRDHGDGIAASEHARIFEPFYRPAGRSESVGGWGLGLALVKQIVSLHGGNIRVESPDGPGTLMIVELPRSRL